MGEESTLTEKEVSTALGRQNVNGRGIPGSAGAGSYTPASPSGRSSHGTVAHRGRLGPDSASAQSGAEEPKSLTQLELDKRGPKYPQGFESGARGTQTSEKWRQVHSHGHVAAVASDGAGKWKPWWQHPCKTNPPSSLPISKREIEVGYLSLPDY